MRVYDGSAAGSVNRCHMQRRYSGPKTRLKRSTPEPEYVDGFFAGRQCVLGEGVIKKRSRKVSAI